MTDTVAREESPVTKRERRRRTPALPYRADRLTSLGDREFLVERREGEPMFVVERWLLTYRKTPTEEQLRSTNERDVVEWFLERAGLPT